MKPPTQPHRIRVQSALLARHYSSELTGDSLIGVFSSITPLDDLDAGRWAQTDCYAYLQLLEVHPGDAIRLRVLNPTLEELMTDSIELEGVLPKPFSLPYIAIVKLGIPHYTYGRHSVNIEHEDTTIGTIPFEVLRMPNPF